MSRGSFVFSSNALRSLQLDEEMLERDKYKHRLASQHLLSYTLKKEALGRTPPKSSSVSKPTVCRDVVIQNALYTGNLEATQQLFPRGSTANLIIEPQGGEMRWVARGKGKRLHLSSLGFNLEIQHVGRALVFTPLDRAMAYTAPKVKWHKPKSFCNDVIATAKASGCVLQFWNSLLVGDELMLTSIADDDEYGYLINATYDTSNVDEWTNFRFNYRSLRLWSLAYEQELTTPLHITAGRGFAECLKVLLQRGASVDLSPGGITALHESCAHCEPECTRILLMHGANANAVTEDGLMSLHLCSSPESLECAKHLIQYGAAINGRTLDEEDTPLHVAARNGLVDHVELYLRYGATVNKKNDEGLTPLNAACSQPQEPQDLQRYFNLCKMLMKAGADIHTSDQDKHTPLHMACKNVNADLVELLLASGAEVNDMDYGGEAPMHNILKVACYKLTHSPERVVRALLNYGSIRVWPGALPMVLRHCSQSPQTIEVLLNAYSHLKVNDTWIESVPPEVMKEHKEFYESVFSLARTPRCLQHLSRCKLRSLLEGRLNKVVPRLELPTFVKNYLLLDSRGYVH